MANHLREDTRSLDVLIKDDVVYSVRSHMTVDHSIEGQEWLGEMVPRQDWDANGLEAAWVTCTEPCMSERGAKLACADYDAKRDGWMKTSHGFDILETEDSVVDEDFAWL